MICTGCGNAVESFNRFCPKCGVPVQPQPPPMHGSPPPYSSPQAPLVGGPVAQPAKKSGCGKIFSTSADGSGNAAFVMSVGGRKASGQYEVNLVRSNSVWRLTKGVVRTNSGQTINITDKSGDSEDANLNSNTDTDINTDENVASGTTVRGGVLNNKAISLPKPAYPPIAKRAKASGTVVVQVLVDEKGNVVSARAVSGHPSLQAVSVAAARGAKFRQPK